MHKPSFPHGRINAVALSMLALVFLSPATAIADPPRYARVSDFLSRSGQPDSEGFKFIASSGVRTVLDLRDAGERSKKEQELVESLGMRYINVPLSTWRKPKDTDIDAILKILADPALRPVHVHCQRGAERTGLVIGLSRIVFDGWAAKRAYAEMRKFDYRWYIRGIKSYLFEFDAHRRAERKSPGR